MVVVKKKSSPLLKKVVSKQAYSSVRSALVKPASSLVKSAPVRLISPVKPAYSPVKSASVKLASPVKSVPAKLANVVKSGAVKRSSPVKSLPVSPVKTTAVKSTPTPVLSTVGKVVHYYDQIGVAVVALKSALKKGETIHIGKQDDFFKQKVTSMQMNRKPVLEAKKGQEIGLKVNERVRPGYLVVRK